MSRMMDARVRDSPIDGKAIAESEGEDGEGGASGSRGKSRRGIRPDCR